MQPVCADRLLQAIELSSFETFVLLLAKNLQLEKTKVSLL